MADPKPEPGWLEGDSPAIKLTRIRYKQAGLFDWDNNRVATVCRQIKCTPYELCAIAGCFTPTSVKACLKHNRWPVTLTIHFRRIEDQIHRLKFMEEPAVGPGPEDIEMSKLIFRGTQPQGKPFVEVLGGLKADLDCVATDGCKATTETIHL